MSGSGGRRKMRMKRNKRIKRGVETETQREDEHKSGNGNYKRELVRNEEHIV